MSALLRYFQTALTVFAFFLLGSRLQAQKVEPALDLGSGTQASNRAAVSPTRLGERLTIPPARQLEAADQVEKAQVQSIRDWNQSGKVPWRSGFVRLLSDPLHVSLPARTPQAQMYSGGALGDSSPGQLAWAASFKVDRARALRIHLTDITVPPGTVFWVYADGRPTSYPFGLDSMDPQTRSLWSPTVEGDTVWLEVQLPAAAAAGSASFSVSEILETITLPEQTLNLGSLPLADWCLITGACIGTDTQPLIADYRKAVSRLTFVQGAHSYLCSGTLLNDQDPSGFVPYLLTANHCFSDQASASSLEAYWDYTATSCNGTIPSLYSVPRTIGSTLLATSASSDFTFVRLAQAPPAPRVYMGWDASSNAAPAGTPLDRVSHPGGYQQHFTRSAVDPSTAFSCLDLPRPNFLYSAVSVGSSQGGSSGSAAIKAGGYVVGQLFGVCGSNIEDNCDIANNRLVDGAFSATYPYLSGWLDAGTTPQPCSPGPTTLCLNGSRFKVEAQWRTPDGSTGAAQAAQQTSDTGSFWFFSSSNLELFVKVLDGRGANGHFWFFWGALTDVEYRITVTDSVTGAVRLYQGVQHVQSSGNDVTAF